MAQEDKQWSHLSFWEREVEVQQKIQHF